MISRLERCASLQFDANLMTVKLRMYHAEGSCDLKIISLEFCLERRGYELCCKFANVAVNIRKLILDPINRQHMLALSALVHKFCCVIEERIEYLD